MDILLWIVLGAAAGWIADLITSSAHGLFADIFLGIIGGIVGGVLMNFFGKSGVTGFNFYSLFVAVIGACVLIFLGRILLR